MHHKKSSPLLLCSKSPVDFAYQFPGSLNSPCNIRSASTIYLGLSFSLSPLLGPRNHILASGNSTIASRVKFAHITGLVNLMVNVYLEWAQSVHINQVLWSAGLFRPHFSPLSNFALSISFHFWAHSQNLHPARGPVKTVSLIHFTPGLFLILLIRSHFVVGTQGFSHLPFCK